MHGKTTKALLCLLLAAALVMATSPAFAAGTTRGDQDIANGKQVNAADRQGAAAAAAAQGLVVGSAVSAAAVPTPGGVPDYFGPYPNFANSPLPTTVTTATATAYFAEGTCRPNFDAYICIQNPGTINANVTITYMKGDGTTATELLVVPKSSRITVMPRQILGTGDDPAHDFSAKVECTNNQLIIAERSMYFNYNGVWTGGHDVVGLAAPGPVFYFAEGTTRPNFDAFICIQNPGASAANVTITYMKGDATTANETLVVPAHSRVTTIPRVTLGTADDAAHDFSAKVECTNGQHIVAERPMYFNYAGAWTGGSDTIGAAAPASIFYFAEGTTRPGFEPYITLQNPGGADANVTVTYMKGDGNMATDFYTVLKNSRLTVLPRATLGVADDIAHDFSTVVHCTNGQNIVAERPMYFAYGGVETGGHDVVGKTAPATTFYFAEGTARPGFDTYICIQNPSLTTGANVKITYMKGDGTTVQEFFTVGKNSRETVMPRVKLGTGSDIAHDFSAKVECTNGLPIVAERPMYFNYNGVWDGGHDAMGDTDVATTSVVAGTGIRKFVDGLAGLGASNANNLGQYIPVAIPDQTTYANDDYYVIELGEYTEKLHSDLPATKLRGYRQVNTTDPTVSKFSYLGPTIVAQRDRPVRVKFINSLPTGAGGDLFIPTDTSVMGAGDGSYMVTAAAADRVGGVGATIQVTTAMPHTLQVGEKVSLTGFTPAAYNGDFFVIAAGLDATHFEVTLPADPGGPATVAGTVQAMYEENRATLHLHGGNTPWISDGTMHQWTTPTGEGTSYPEGVAVHNVPDMDGGTEPQGTLTFYYTNQQSARLMFYHDHAYGLTRLNVYAGEAAPYIVQDPAEASLVSSGSIPPTSAQIPLVIQDKTFVPDAAQLAAEDPTWDTNKWGGLGSLWFPHVYMPNQNPFNGMGANAMGRWDYGPWFWPPVTGLTFGPIANPYYDPINAPWEPPQIPGTPNPSIVPEAFCDTPLVNGTAYPTVTLQPKAYRFRVLNASNDRYWNLQLYKAKSNNVMWNPDGTLADGNAGEVNMVPANPNTGLPASWPTDGRDGGVPDPAAVGPDWYQIGTEGGLLPAVADLAQTPVGYDYNRRSITVLNVLNKTLFLGPAERADVVVDFSKYAGQTLILYNDAPAPVPGFDPRNDYYTGDPNQTTSGGAPTTLSGYGPNTRTVMQIKIAGTPAAPFSLTKLQTNLPVAYAASQEKPIVPQDSYNAAFNANYPANNYVAIQDTSKSFFNGPLPGLSLTSGGSGYTSAPGVSVTGGGGTGALGTTQIGGVTGTTITAGGTGYTSAPTVDFTAGGGTGATGTAQISGVNNITVTNGGTGYTSPPDVTITGGGGTGAVATATLTAGAVTAVTVSNGGTGYKSPVAVSITGGGGTGATAYCEVLNGVIQNTVVVTNGGSGYTTAPAVAFFDAGGQGATAVATVAGGQVTAVTITNGGSGFSTAPSVTFTGGGLAALGATATATIGLGQVTGIIITDTGSGYAAGPFAVGLTGGGYSVQATATATGSPGVVTQINLTNAGTGYSSAPAVNLTGGGGNGATAVPLAINMEFTPKSIIEDFDMDYGRMNAMLGVEVPRTNNTVQTSIPYYDVDPPTEVLKDSTGATAIGTLADGTQIWKITHNGVDTHAIHWHMFNVQLVNRVGWDGMIKPPDANEIGWKETIRMNPLEDIIVALRPIVPTLPVSWGGLPNSIRAMDPTMPLGTVPQFHGIDPTNMPAPVTNSMINYGWEYVWHCHLLGHEENLMMRTMGIAVAPAAATGAAAAGAAGPVVNMQWTDSSNNETNWTIQRGPSNTGPWTTLTVAQSTTGPATGGTVTFTDHTVAALTTYWYRVLATNIVGDTQLYAAPTVGYPTQQMDSAATTPVSATTP